MRRALVSLFVLLAPAIGLLTAAGCEDKIDTVERTEQTHESEPQPVSPGEPVLK